MGHILSEVFPFLASVFAHWHIWLSGGGVGGIIVIAANLVEKFFNKSLSKRASLYLFVIAFFLCSCFLSWVDRNDEVARLSTTNVSLMGQMDGWKVTCAQKDGAINVYQQQITNQQRQINNCLLQQKEIPVVRAFPISREQNSAPRMEYVITTNVERSPVDLIAKCDIPISGGSLYPLTTTGGSNFSLAKNLLSPNNLKFSLGSPAWSPSDPLWVTVFFVPPVNRMPRCSFTTE